MFSLPISSEDRLILSWLSSIKNFNGRLGHNFIDSLSSPKDIFTLSDKQLSEMLPPAACKALTSARTTIPLSLIQEKISRAGARYVSYYDSDYPNHLKTIPDAPLGIFVKGSLPSDSSPSVAVIGARNCSEYGMHIAAELGGYLGRSGIQVISGMAYGIDGISQRAALDAGGTSFAVLGSGVDVCYPATNRTLYDRLPQSGGIISTYGMGEPAIASNFPPRNRIVSGLSDAVIVVEARQKSGTIITVDMALEQGREVYAVPGRITDRLSDGCNGLIGQGANVYLSPEIFVAELLDHLGYTSSATSQDSNQMHRNFNGNEHIPEGLDSEQSAVYSQVSVTPTNIDDICDKLNSTSQDFSYSKVSMILMQLMLSGHVKQVTQGNFCKIIM